MEQLSHWSPWPQGSDTEPCSPQVTQHCRLCFLYTTWNTKHLHLNITYKKHDYSSSVSSTMKVNTSLVCAADSKMKYVLNCIKVTCSTACKQLQSWACKLSTDSKGSRWSSWSWWSARWGLSPLLKLSSASCRREAFFWASSSACLALSASMANLAAWARDSSASAFNAAQDYNRHRI